MGFSCLFDLIFLSTANAPSYVWAMMDRQKKRSAVAAAIAVMLCNAQISAFAQSEAEPEVLPPVAQQPGGESQPEADDSVQPLPRDATEQVRAAHLDQLFGRLAMADNPDWERVQQQIWAAWNHSGSPSMDFLAHRADAAMPNRTMMPRWCSLTIWCGWRPTLPRAGTSARRCTSCSRTMVGRWMI